MGVPNPSLCRGGHRHIGCHLTPVISAAFVLLLACAPAEAVSYDVSSVPSNWIPSTSHTVIASWATGLGCPDTVGDDSLSAVLNLGFTFRFGATTYTQVRVNTNGRIQFNNTYCGFGTQATSSPRTYPDPLPGANMSNVLRIYGADLDENAAGTISYASIGIAPNRIFVVTWNNVSAWREGGAQNRGGGTAYNLQIQLHESGDFYYVYGISDDITEPTNAAMGPAQIGWQIDSLDFALVRTGLPANNTAYRFTLGRPYAEFRMDDGVWNGTAGEVADSSGNGRNGSRVAVPLQSAVVQTIPSGRICRAMDVPDNGGTTQIDAVNSTFTPNVVGTLGSITFWWRARKDWNGTANYLIDATTQAGRFFYLGKRNNSRLRFEITDNAAAPVTVAAETANTGIGPNTWKHIAITWRIAPGSNATIINIYLDGVLVATSTGTTNGQLNTTLGTIYVGDNRTSASNGLTGSPTSADGAVDEFRAYSRVLTAADVQTVVAETRAVCPVVGAARFLLSHGSYAINCRVEPVTVSALDGFNGLVGTYSGIVTLTTQSGRGSFSLISGNGTLLDAVPDDGVATYQFVPADNGQTTLGLSYQAGVSPVDVDVYQTDDPSIRDDDTEGPLAFAPSGFTVTAAALTNPPPNSISSPIPTQTAGSPFSVYLTAYGQTPTDPQCGVIESYTGNHTLQFWMDHLNPTPGVLNASVNGLAVGPNEAAAVGQNLAFSLGQAAFTAKYKDVGSIRLLMKDPAALPGIIRGATNAFVVMPANLTISRVETLAGVVNPGAATAVGTAFVAAGATFRVEVDARDSEGSLTPGYGTESPPEGLRIVSAALVLPVGGRNGSSGTGTLGGATAFAVAGTPGRLRNSSVQFDEVGAIRLLASVADGDYLGTGPITATPSGNVGRFYPAQFSLVAGSSITAACGTYTYMNQPNLGVGFRIEARETGGGRTWNYDSALLGANAVAASAIAAENNNAGVDLGARLSNIVGPWVKGATDVNTSSAAFARTPAPDGPYDTLAFGVRTIDPLNNTALFNADMNATTTGDCTSGGNCNAVKIGTTTLMRYGRLMVKPAFGPESRDLAVSIESQFFNGKLFERNALDTCTTYTQTQASLTGHGGNLAAGETTVIAPALATALVTGESNSAAPLLLSAPGIGNDGTVDLTLDTPAYLEFDWSGAGSTDPSGTARFGRYRGNDRVIFWRER